MEKVDFCFLVTETFVDAKNKVLISKELKRRGYSSFFITTSKAGDIVFKKAGLSNFRNLDEISNIINIKDSNLENKIIGAEKIFRIKNIRTEILTEKIVFKEKNEKVMTKKLIRYLISLKNLFDEEIEAHYFVQGMSGSLNSIAFYYVGKLKGKHIYFSPAPFLGLFNFSFHRWGILEINDKKIELGLTAKEKKFISDYIKKLKEEKKINLVLPLAKANPFLTKERIKTLFRLLRTSKLEHLPTFFLIKNFWQRYFRKFYIRKFYKKPESGEKYVFFPLHFPDDSQLTIRALPFITQEFIIEIVSRYLPFGYKIYVKEHPASIGYFPIKMLDYIHKLPNVKIVPPNLNPYDLIERSEMVFVINSTVGFEALIYQKPVITFGKSFYREKGVTLDVKNLYDLPEIIKKARNFKPDWDKILTLFNFWYKNSFSPSPQDILYTSLDPTPKNIKIFCNSLFEYLKLNLNIG